ncbi:MAG: hypothetical protein HY858_00035 [Candidatus Solibacter usitatus]|nr:hypothetical protein [Candidatus Solibacter usitatus]
MISATLLLLAGVTLGPELEAWKKQIESQGGVPVLVAKVDFDRAKNELYLAPDTPGRELFTGYLKQEEFVKQFHLMNAVMIHHRAPGAQAYLVLLNGARESDWADHQPSLLAHEFGHAWLKARGFPTPLFVNDRWACISIHAGDITQHVLIRQELDRRGIDFRTFWLKSLGQATTQFEGTSPPPEEDRCTRVRQVAQSVDVRLGLKPGEWAGQSRYETAVGKTMPEVNGTVESIVSYLKERDMADKDQHREALKFVFERLRDLAAQRTDEYRVENRAVSTLAGVN